jgi:AcrR family transcriptional regulator
VRYSQPVLYSHFANKEAIVAAVAVEGFVELAAALEEAATRPGAPGPSATRPGAPGAVRGLAAAYLAFAREHPALYDAMFTMSVGVPFAASDTPEPLHRAFAQLAGATRSEAEAEVLWATLHGLATLGRGGRFRPAAEAGRIDALSALLASPPA